MQANTASHPRISLFGTVTERLVEIRYFESGVIRTTFQVETPDGQSFDVEIYGRQAETAAECVRPRNMIAIHGDLVLNRENGGLPFQMVRADSFATIR